MELLLQRDVFTEDEASDTESVIRRHFDVRVVDDTAVYFGEGLPANYSGVFRGSLALASRLGRSFTWADALRWAPAFRGSLVGKPFFFSDADGLLADVALPFPWPLFIRPTSGAKTFSGGVFTKEEFVDEMNFLVKSKNGDPFSICMFAKPVPIRREWRTIFVNNKYSSGSQYMLDGEKTLSACVPNEVVAFAGAIAESSYFQNIFDFTLDVAEVPGGLGMLEVNGFETASFYAADLEKVYSDWSKSLCK